MLSLGAFPRSEHGFEALELLVFLAHPLLDVVVDAGEQRIHLVAVVPPVVVPPAPVLSGGETGIACVPAKRAGQSGVSSSPTMVRVLRMLQVRGGQGSEQRRQRAPHLAEVLQKLSVKRFTATSCSGLRTPGEALRPEEAVALRRGDLILPAHGHGKIVLTAACPRTGTAWTSTGKPHEARCLKHRPDGAIRVVPIPAVLVGILRQHLLHFGTGPDGRLFRGTRGGILSESVYGRVWHAARQAALSPALATALARRPYDLRHAALSLWLNASGAPAEVAARAGNSTRVLHDTYLH